MRIAPLLGLSWMHMFCFTNVLWCSISIRTLLIGIIAIRALQENAQAESTTFVISGVVVVEVVR